MTNCPFCVVTSARCAYGCHMPDPEWKTVRVRAAKHAAMTARAKAAGVSVAEWLDRTLAAALSEAKGPTRREQAAPGPVDPSGSARAAAPRRASEPDLRAQYASERQAKLNAAKYGGKR